MHPLLVLLAFSIAAVVSYVVVLAALTAASVIDDEEPGPRQHVPDAKESAHACC